MFEGWTYTTEGRLVRPDGEVVDTKPNSQSGYLTVRVNYTSYYQHRIVFLLANGYMPEEVDHKDRNKINNRPDNLRDTTGSANCQNRGVRSDSTSGIKGVSFVGRGWQALFTLRGERKRRRGLTYEEAVNQRRTWEEEAR